jgi:nitrogen fixation/metabolism regulation signal transduction histidine kinase
VIRSIGRTELRVVIALLVTALLPLLAGMWLADRTISNVSSTAFHPEFEEHLDRSLDLYKDLVASMKNAMRQEGAAIAAGHSLRVAAEQGDKGAITGELDRALALHPTLLSAEVVDAEDEPLARRARKTPLDDTRERPFTVRTPLADGNDDVPHLVAIFAADRRRLDEMEGAQEFAQGYKALARKQRGALLEQPHFYLFALLLGITVLLAATTGVFVVRPQIRRIAALASATRPVAEGDLTVRVDANGRDEIADLARSFNQMLEQLGKSRARIEFLKRVGEWQQMARRLAHEIKNPLTPIQLAVEECHRRYDGSDKGYKRLLQTTVDIVVEEVQSLRRLVNEFAAFARLPQADLRKGDLRDFLVEQQPRLNSEASSKAGDGTFELEVENEEMPVALDRTMFYRVLANLVLNGAEAAAEKRDDKAPKPPRVEVHVRRDLDTCTVDVDDNGPGISEPMRQAIFDPYVTTKKEGTGLGLTIAKKIVIDHGGHIDVDSSPLGGARFRLRLPLWGTSASEAAMIQSERHPVSG